MGEVYAAYDPELHRNVAIKLLRAGRNSDSADGRARLMREAQAIARVSHPNVVVVYDAGTFQNRVFVAMELVPGHTLRYWIHERPRTWPEVLEVFCAAGRGLAAAHERELVHRDFKPDNVMVGADGQPRVMDFGLVQLATRTDRRKVDERAAPIAASRTTTVAALPAADEEVMSTRVVSNPTWRDGAETPAAHLTQTGISLGTPAYMSPEQFAGELTDARTDQFSFCVALYEALYGERPFAGRTVHELAETVGGGMWRDAPPGAVVPRWIRDVLLRGLRVNPGQRWPSMNALLAELDKQPAVANRRRFTAAAAAKLAGIWEAPRGDRPVETPAKIEILQAFLSTGKAYAAKACENVTQTLDRYARRWCELYVEACEATHVRGEQSAEVLDLRMACLQEGLEDLKALCRVFRQATPEVVENAAGAANALGGLERCQNVEMLRALVKPPQDPATREIVDQLRSRLAEVRALCRVGRLNDSSVSIIPLEKEARAIAYGPLLADILTTVGTLRLEAGLMNEAAAAMEEALWTATKCRHDEVAAEAAVLLTYIVGWGQSRPDLAEFWSRLAEALLVRMGGHDLLWGWLYQNRAGMRDSQGRLTEALADARAAVAAKEKVLEPNHPDLGLSISSIAIYLEGLGDLTQAVEYGCRAVKIVEDGLGPDHPRTALVLSNCGELLARAERFDEAGEVGARALTIYERETDPEGIFVTYPLLTVGLSHLGAGRVEQALPVLERANRIRDAKESTPAKRGEVRFALARALWEGGHDRARALALAHRARDEYRESHATPATERDLATITGWLASHPAA